MLSYICICTSSFYLTTHKYCYTSKMPFVNQNVNRNKNQIIAVFHHCVDKLRNAKINHSSCVILGRCGVIDYVNIDVTILKKFLLNVAASN